MSRKSMSEAVWLRKIQDPETTIEEMELLLLRTLPRVFVPVPSFVNFPMSLEVTEVLVDLARDGEPSSVRSAARTALARHWLNRLGLDPDKHSHRDVVNRDAPGTDALSHVIAFYAESPDHSRLRDPKDAKRLIKMLAKFRVSCPEDWNGRFSRARVEQAMISPQDMSGLTGLGAGRIVPSLYDYLRGRIPDAEFDPLTWLYWPRLPYGLNDVPQVGSAQIERLVRDMSLSGDFFQRDVLKINAVAGVIFRSGSVGSRVIAAAMLELTSGVVLFRQMCQENPEQMLNPLNYKSVVRY